MSIEDREWADRYESVLGAYQEARFKDVVTGATSMLSERPDDESVSNLLTRASSQLCDVCTDVPCDKMLTVLFD